MAKPRSDQGPGDLTNAGLIQGLQLHGLHIQPQLRDHPAQLSQLQSKLVAGLTTAVSIDQRIHALQSRFISEPDHRVFTAAIAERQTADGFRCRFQQPHRHHQLRLAVHAVVVEQPIRQRAQRVVQFEFAVLAVGHHGQQTIDPGRGMVRIVEPCQQLIAPTLLVLGQVLLHQRPLELMPLQRTDGSGIQHLQLIHRCRQPEAGELMTGQTSGLIRGAGGLQLHRFKQRLKPCHRPGHRQGGSIDAGTERRIDRHAGRRQQIDALGRTAETLRNPAAKTHEPSRSGLRSYVGWP